jgi:NADPH:quinone reductase-like Zn-dependent oxidoreductase
VAPTSAKGYRLLARGGVLVSYAFAGRPGHMVADTVRDAIRVKLLNLLPGKRTALCTVLRRMESDHAWYQRSLRRLLQMAQSGELTAPTAVTFPLDQVADAHRARASHEISGKVVLTTT